MDYQAYITGETELDCQLRWAKEKFLLGARTVEEYEQEVERALENHDIITGRRETERIRRDEANEYWEWWDEDNKRRQVLLWPYSNNNV